jgi:hypothetical protein
MAPGLDPRSQRARFLAWLTRHADGGEDAARPGSGDPGNAYDLPAAQIAVDDATADPIRDYLARVGQLPRLSVEQETGLYPAHSFLLS